MTAKLRRWDKDLLTIEQLAEEAGISKALIAKLVGDEVIFPVGDKRTLEGMSFHESTLRVIKRWEEVRGGS
jgi:hypothetical protein